MMILFDGFWSKRYKSTISRIFANALAHTHQPDGLMINVSIVSRSRITHLNATTRNVDRATDVLSYPYTSVSAGESVDMSVYSMDIDRSNGTLLLGEIFICKSVARKNAAKYGHSLFREICFLATHGLLHLLGHDHMKGDERIIMEKLQDEILTSCGVTREAK